MRFRRQILILPLFAIIIALCLMMASCSYIEGLLGKKETVAPTIISVEQLKTDLDYLNSKEYLYNKDSDAVMPLKSGESFLISIKYENPSEHAISYLKVNNEKIMASKFEEDSTKTNTIIKLTASESKTSLEETFTINSIFYNAGAETKRMAFNDEIDMEFKVVIEPTYNLTLNYQNADRRAASMSQEQKSATQRISFKADLASFSVADANYEATAGLPYKAGGWVFDGYYTEPNGRGTLVTQNDKYYFWGDVTLYAYFSRLFTYEIVDLKTALGVNDIKYNYKYNGEDGEKTFYKGAIITGNTQKGHPIIDIGTTLVDEVVNYNKDTGKFVNVTATEYPIIKIGNNAFEDVNTMTTLSIGKYVEEIGASAFENCNKLERVTFDANSNLKYIGDRAFQDTVLMGISTPFTLPDNVEYLGNFAFRSSGWKNTTNIWQDDKQHNESILHIKPQYKFIGAECFFNTRFNEVVFDPGCYFEKQITAIEAEAIDDMGGWKSIGNMSETGLGEYPNAIGAGIFGNCPELYEVSIKGLLGANEVYTPAINIIPDLAFDRENYTTTGLIVLTIDEGVKYIGNRAFTYQEKLQILSLPSSLEEIDKYAFYNCTSVYEVTFREDTINEVYSQLKTLRTACFGNLLSLVRVQIVSKVFERYGNGPFSNCDSLKSIEFPNLNEENALPRGFSEGEDKSEVSVGHLYSDFMYATFESGKLRQAADEETIDIQTYSVPTRIFCNGSVMNAFKTSLENGKKLKAGGVETGNGAYRDSIFLYDINLISRNYVLDPTNENSAKTDIALQAIYSASDNKIIGYNMAFWSDRSKNIVIPELLNLTINGHRIDCTIIQIGSRSLPTSVQTVTIPKSVKRLQNDAFSNCTSLTEVNFEKIDNLDYIGENAFMGTLVSSFTGGTSLKAVGQYAFWKCSSLLWVDLSQSTLITNGYMGRKEIKKQYIYDYELKAIQASNGDKDSLDYANALHNGAFQGCRTLEWIYLPPNLQRMSRSLFEGCRNLKHVIIENNSISTSTDPTDVNEVCFYANAQATTVYDREALAKGMIIYGNNIDKHQIVFENGNYRNIDAKPDHP